MGRDRSMPRARASWRRVRSLAALSLLAPSAPTTDPWGWIVAGAARFSTFSSRRLCPGRPRGSRSPSSSPRRWRSLAAARRRCGSCSARAGALVSLVAAARLVEQARRSAGRPLPSGLILARWLRAFAHGYTEPLAIGLLVLAVDQHLSGRPRRALVLGRWWLCRGPRRSPWSPRTGCSNGVAASSISPGGGRPGDRGGLWIVPDWIGSGDPFHASHVAVDVVHTGGGATLRALSEAIVIVPLPLSLTAVAGPVLAIRRRRPASSVWPRWSARGRGSSRS